MFHSKKALLKIYRPFGTQAFVEIHWFNRFIGTTFCMPCVKVVDHCKAKTISLGHVFVIIYTV